MMFYQPGVQLVLHVNSTALPFMGMSYTTLAQAQARKFWWATVYEELEP